MTSHLRYAFRQLRRAPGFATVAILTLGLGIGACAAIFTVVNGVLLRPLPVPDADRIVLVNESSPRQVGTTVAIGKYVEWRAQARSFEEMGALAGQSYNLTGVGEPVHLVGGRITASLLATLRLAPALGRNFTAEDERPFGQENVAMLGHGLWRTMFGARPDVVGRTIQLSGRAFVVVGVMPPETALPERVQIFTPLGFFPNERRTFGLPFLHVLGRLRPGVPAGEARSELGVIFERIAAARGIPSPQRSGWAVKLTPLYDSIVGNVRPVLWSLLGAVGFLLLIACSNVASLLLARGSARAGEIALRAALGASRERVVRQLLGESLLLAVLGGAVGLGFAQLGLEALLALAPESLPRVGRIALDGRVLAVTTLIIGGSAVAFGLVPALHAARVSLSHRLHQTGRSSAGGTGQRLRRALVSGEVAVALVLLAGAGLLMRSFARLQEVSPGFSTANAFVAETFLPRPQYASSEQYISFAQATMDEIAALPGVEAAAVANNLPFSKHHATYAMMARLSLPGQAGAPDELTLANESSVSPDYFRAMGIPLLRGRSFDRRDVASGAAAVVISESVARKFFPGQDPVGRGISVFGMPPHEIIGVAGDVKQASLDGDASMQVYRAFTQLPDNDQLFVVRTRTGDPAVLGAIRAAITRSDRNVPVYGAQPLSTLIGSSIGRQQFSMTVFAAFSGVALVLAVIGIYGVMAYSVSQRTGEIGIRMALGARAEAIARLVLSEGGRLVAIGLGAGVIGALLVTGFMEKLLFGVRAHDPLTYVAVAVTVLLVALPACLVPALRAARVDPMRALRGD